MGAGVSFRVLLVLWSSCQDGSCLWVTSAISCIHHPVPQRGEERWQGGCRATGTREGHPRSTDFTFDAWICSRDQGSVAPGDSPARCRAKGLVVQTHKRGRQRITEVIYPWSQSRCMSEMEMGPRHPGCQANTPSAASQFLMVILLVGGGGIPLKSCSFDTALWTSNALHELFQCIIMLMMAPVN